MMYVIIRGQTDGAAQNGAASSSSGTPARNAASSLQEFGWLNEAKAGRRCNSPSAPLVRLTPSAMAATSSCKSTPLKPVLEASSANWRQFSLPPMGTLFMERYMGLFEVPRTQATSSL